LLQKLVPVFDHLTSTLRDLQIDRLVVLGSNSGNGAGAPGIKSVLSANEQLRAATGVDLMAAAKGRLGGTAE
jgi:hypothetical protein